MLSFEFLLFCIELNKTQETTHKKNLSFENEHNYTYIISILKIKEENEKKKHKKIKSDDPKNNHSK